MNFGPNVISTMLLVTPRSISLGEHDLGHCPWSRVTINNLEIKVAFLLGKSV